MRSSMTEVRAKISGKENAGADLGEARSKPAWLKNQHVLPFQMLSPDEFEIFCYLLLLRENPQDNIYYYGKTGDAGRDIVWHKDDGSIELIQCKRYQSKVGINEIRTEIEKLYVNCHRQVIPEKPTSVVFYVVPDLTAPAQDLILYPANLKKQFSGELLEFAPTWRPALSKQTAIELTERANKHQTLIEEFFGYQKVIDATALEPVLEALEELKRNQAILLQPKSPNASVALQSLLVKAEEENPGLSFSISQTSQSSTIILTAKPSAGAVQFASLVFPDTELGNRGLEKFRLLTEEGRPIELEPDEYNWQWEMSLPEIGSPPFRLTTLKLIPNIPEYPIPCRVDVLQGNEVISTVPFTYFRILRIGTKEIEFCITDGQLQGELSFVSSFERDNTLLTYKEWDLYSIPAEQAKSAIELMLALHTHGKLRVISLEDKAVLIKDVEADEKSSNFAKEEFKNAFRFLEKLDKINQAFNLSILYPEGMSAEIEEQADVIVNAIEKGKVEHAEGTVSLSYTPKQALEVLESFESDGNFELTLTAETEYSFLGQKLNMGETEVTLKDVSLIENAELNRANFIEAQNSGSEKVDIRLRYSRSIEKYRRWFKENIEKSL